LEELYRRLCWLSLDGIWHLGDLVDRGPNSGKAVEFCRTKGIKGVLGNHDDTIIGHWDRFTKHGFVPRNVDKQRTLREVVQADIDYLRTLPYLHVIDDLSVVLVHGGLFPRIPLYAQNSNVCRLQMVHPDFPGKSVWWGEDAKLMYANGKTEEEQRALGWERWYKVYDHEQDVYFGHSTWAQPMIWQNEGAGKCVGIDTGSCFGGSVTAAIIDSSRSPVFLSVKCKKLYYPDAHRAFNEG
jgi:diadenosine tetraphosphatase ApaH/serine/threonine PP2A family protein phosphatase